MRLGVTWSAVEPCAMACTRFAPAKSRHATGRPAAVTFSISGDSQSISIPGVMCLVGTDCFAGNLVVDLVPGVPVSVSAATTPHPLSSTCVTVKVYCPTVALGVVATYILSLTQWQTFFIAWRRAWEVFSSVSSAAFPWSDGDSVVVNDTSGEIRSLRVPADVLDTVAFAAKRAEKKQSVNMKREDLMEVGTHVNALHHLCYGNLGAFASVRFVTEVRGPITTRILFRMHCGTEVSTVDIAPPGAAVQSRAVCNAVARGQLQVVRRSCCEAHFTQDTAKRPAASCDPGFLTSVGRGFAVTMGSGLVLTFSPASRFLLMAEVLPEAKADTPCIKASFGTQAFSATDLVVGSHPLTPTEWLHVETRVCCFLEHTYGIRVVPGTPLLIAVFGCNAEDLATGQCMLMLVHARERPVRPGQRGFEMFNWNVCMSKMETTDEDPEFYVVDTVVTDHAAGPFLQRTLLSLAQSVRVFGARGITPGASVPLKMMVENCKETLNAAAAASTQYKDPAPALLFGALASPLASPLGVPSVTGGVAAPTTPVIPSIPFLSPPRPQETPFSHGIHATDASQEDADAMDALDAKLGAFPFTAELVKI